MNHIKRPTNSGYISFIILDEQERSTLLLAHDILSNLKSKLGTNYEAEELVSEAQSYLSDIVLDHKNRDKEEIRFEIIDDE